ncbi:unnamed protein product [Staurois parvus]|uniref:Uncharacterized protein n=1 Tax=Staurois parvus TaxID=386267 RepID=A0ABN9E8Z1_9NEOB|nr:unnamed protein product [Staurois parvus]
MARVWRWRTAAMGGRTGTHERLLDCGSSMRRRILGAHARLGAWQQLWEARNLPAPAMSKKLNNTSSDVEET